MISETDYWQKSAESLRRLRPLIFVSISVALTVATVGAFVFLPVQSVIATIMRSATDKLDEKPESEVSRLVASDGTINSQFGSSVAINGNYLVVGAPLSRDVANVERGAAYIFVRNGPNWMFQTKLESPDEDSNLIFGSGVSISGDTVVVGAPGLDVNNIRDVGAAYVYVRNGETWNLQQRLVASDPRIALELAEWVSLDSDILLLGALDSAYVFTRTGSIWTEEAKLTDPLGDSSDQFGSSVDINGNTAVVGAPFGGESQMTTWGIVCVFVRSGTTWTLQARLSASDREDGDKFGAAVAIEGDNLIIGSPRDRNVGNSGVGSVDVFRRNGTAWTEEGKIRRNELGSGIDFASTIDISGDRIIIGEPKSDVLGHSFQGAAYVFIHTGASWQFQNKLTASNGAVADLLGWSVAIQDNRFLVGAPWVDIGNNSNQGAAYFFIQSPGVPDLQASSDSGLSNSDNITNNQNLTFDVSGITAGATVELLRNGTVVDSKIVGQATTTLTDASVPANNAFQYKTRQTVGGEISSLSEPLAVTIDTIGPSVTIDQAPGQIDPTAQGTCGFQAIFSEAISGFDPSDISMAGSTADVSNATVSIIQDVTPHFVSIGNVVSDGQFVIVVVPAGAVTDIAGNPSSASTSTDNRVTIDNVRPSVTVNQAAGQPDPTASQPINYTAIFSEPVTGFDSSDVSVSGSTANTTGRIINLTGAGTTYNIAISGITSDGQFVRVSVPGGAQDALGNGSLPSTSTDNTVTLDNVYVSDGGFELTTDAGQNPYWSSSSTRFGTSLCTVAACGTGSGTAAPRNGNGWVWFDGTGQTAAEQGSVSQAVTLPMGGVVTLNYYLRIGVVNAPFASTLQVKVDDTTVQTTTEPSTSESAYTQRTIDLSTYADGATHTLRFEYNRPAGGASDNFILDDVSLLVSASAPRRSPFDFDGDGKTDVGIFRPSVGEWWYQRSSNSQVAALQFGTSTDKMVPGDFTGDGKTDIAFWRPSNGNWFVLRSEDSSFFAFPFGAAGDIPAPADYDGDGRTDPAVFRPATTTWFISNSGGSGTSILTFGISTDKPVVADYDGDAKADIAIWRAGPGEWWGLRSTNGSVFAVQFGTTSDRPVQGDYTGDGKADIAFWRPADGNWFVVRSEDSSFFAFPFGSSGDIPVPGDYDGDGRTDSAVFRPSSATWFLNRSTAGVAIQQFGLTSDTPIPSAFVP